MDIRPLAVDECVACHTFFFLLCEMKVYLANNNNVHGLCVIPEEHTYQCNLPHLQHHNSLVYHHISGVLQGRVCRHMESPHKLPQKCYLNT